MLDIDYSLHSDAQEMTRTLRTMMHRRGALLRVLGSSSSGAAFASTTANATAEQKPSRVYESLVKQGALTLDRAQSDVLKKYLDKLHSQLDGYVLPVFEDDDGGVADERGAAQDSAGGETTVKTEPPPPQQILVPRGLYLHGSVGTGKSMLMDLFFANVTTQQKRRVHFNKFMLEVHERIQAHKQRQLALYGRQRHIDLDPSKDVITRVAEQIASESHLLCFDEFQVTDIADALIMRKLFGVFFSKGVVMVATSNTPPTVKCLCVSKATVSRIDCAHMTAIGVVPGRHEPRVFLAVLGAISAPHESGRDQIRRRLPYAERVRWRNHVSDAAKRRERRETRRDLQRTRRQQWLWRERLFHERAAARACDDGSASGSPGKSQWRLSGDVRPALQHGEGCRGLQSALRMFYILFFVCAPQCVRDCILPGIWLLCVARSSLTTLCTIL